MKKINYCKNLDESDILQAVGSSMRKNGDMSGVIAIRESFNKNKIEWIINKLWDDCGILTIRKPQVVQDNGWIIVIDRLKKETIAINYINKLVNEIVAEEVQHSKQPNTIKNVEQIDEKNSEIDLVPIPYSI